ncbi:MAG: glycoside hydrolase family 9 protein [Steroidobacter sp.]
MLSSRVLVGAALCCCVIAAHAEEATLANISVNQVGFLPDAHKVAVVPALKSLKFSIIKAGTSKVVLTGKMTASATWAPADEKVSLADFSRLANPGEYQIRVAGLPDSARFTVAADEYNTLNRAALRYYYLNRAGIAIDARHGGKYARAEGHPDDHVLVHASAATASRPEGTVISSPKGWYDAGDYNKYIVNSAITVYTLLAACEHFPQYYRQHSLNIPESGNHVPDVLNEAMWNLAWMLSMQDEDGGVYHKLTSKLFDSFEMPDQDHSQRYVVQKTTAATLDFAAVMAVASRVYKPYDAVYPGFSTRALQAAEHAWQWAQAHPSELYHQPDDIKTGAYGDNNVSDEFAWAATELYITTKNDDYYRAVHLQQVMNGVPSWGNVSGLVWMSLAQHRNELTPIADQQLIATRVDELASILLSRTENSAYDVALQAPDFVWGSNGVALNQAMMLIQGYRLNHDRAYLDAAQALFDYVLGRNPTGYSFVTGFGDKSPMHPHHRLSESDGVVDPVPGMVVGGATALQTDSKGCKVPYPSRLPAESYLDNICSYTTNEIAINWNAPLVYVSGALQVLTRRK